MKKALITGITGQDGSYLAELLLDKGYEVHGIIRRASTFNTQRIDHIYQDPHEENIRLKLHYGDMTDSSNLSRLVEKINPDEIYNLAAQSHVGVSFDMPEYTTDVDAMGTLRLLDAIKESEVECKFYQASTSELYGEVQEIPQTEKTPFYPRSPYAAAKLYAYWIVKNYREAYDLFAVNGILFNHECISENTPLITRENGFISIKRPCDIKKPKAKGKNIQQYLPENIEIWDGDDFVELSCMTATRRKKDNSDFECRVINTRHGSIEVTNHHNMLDENKKKIKAKNVKIDSKLLHKEFPQSKELTALSVEEAEFLGMMVGDGSISEKGKGFFACNDKKIMEKFKGLWSRVAQGTLTIKNYNTEYGSSKRASLIGNNSYLRYIQKEIYTNDKYKKIPDRILNAPENIQLSFLEGYNQADGLKSNPCTYKFKNFKTNSIILAQGLIFLINQTTGQDFNITFESDENYYGYYSINLLSPVDNSKKEDQVKELAAAGVGQREINRKTGISRDFIRKIENGGHAVSEHHFAKSKIKVKKVITDNEQPEWVFDLETESGKFMAGIGNIVVSNSPRRGKRFVTRKITRAVARITKGKQDKIYLGNMNAKRDWGYAKDYVKMMWMMLQHDTPKDYVIATGETHTVREFVEAAFSHVDIEIEWQGKGVDEKGIDKDTGKVLVEVDPKYFRPTEVDLLIGDPNKAKEELGWEPEVKFKELVQLMVQSDLEAIEKHGDI
jgi:GDPmannose 4,6-dehydratase